MGLEAEASSSSSTQPAAGAAETQETKNHPNGSGKSMLGKIISAIVNFFRAPGAQFEGNGNKIGHDYDNSGGGLTSEGAGSPGGSGKEPQTNSSSNFNQPNTYWIVDLDGVNGVGPTVIGSGVLDKTINYANGIVAELNSIINPMGKYGYMASKVFPSFQLFSGNLNDIRLDAYDALPHGSGVLIIAKSQTLMREFAYKRLSKEFLKGTTGIKEFLAVYHKDSPNYNINTEISSRLTRFNVPNFGLINFDRIIDFITTTNCNETTPVEVVLSHMFFHVLGHNAGMDHPNEFGSGGQYVMRGGGDICPIQAGCIYNMGDTFCGDGLKYLQTEYLTNFLKWFR